MRLEEDTTALERQVHYLTVAVTVLASTVLVSSLAILISVLR